MNERPEFQRWWTRGSLVAQDLITDNHAGLSDPCPRRIPALENMCHGAEEPRTGKGKFAMVWTMERTRRSRQAIGGEK
jgi:hypothetical protein